MPRAFARFELCPAVSARGLTKSFSRGLASAPRRKDAVASIDIDLHPGDLTAIVGGAGAGKTTLLQCLAGLLRPDGGKVDVFGERLSGGWCPPGVAFVPATPVYYPFLTPGDVIGIRVARENFHNRGRDEVGRFIEALGLESVARTRIVALAPDLIRRVSVAEALAGRPGVLLMDTSPQDFVSHFHPSVVSSLAACAGEGTAVAVAARDPSAIAFAATGMFLMEKGRLSRTFALESLGEPIVARPWPPGPRFVAERVH